MGSNKQRQIVQVIDESSLLYGAEIDFIYTPLRQARQMANVRSNITLHFDLVFLNFCIGFNFHQSMFLRVQSTVHQYQLSIGIRGKPYHYHAVQQRTGSCW